MQYLSVCLPIRQIKNKAELIEWSGETLTMLNRYERAKEKISEDVIRLMLVLVKENRSEEVLKVIPVFCDDYEELLRKIEMNVYPELRSWG